MESMIMYILSFVAISIVITMLLKKLDIKITLLAVGMLLIISSMFLGKTEVKTFNDLLYPVKIIVDQFKSTLPSAGLIILMLGGYTSYMNAIGANDVTVNTLTKPLKLIKSPYALVPVVFLLGNFLSLVIPSASNLAIILLATLYPILRKSGMTVLTAAAVIATTATIMPTPLGGDNVAIATELGIPVSDYVFNYHAIVSLPTLAVIAITHYFWQRFMDGRDIKNGKVLPNDVDIENIKEINGCGVYRFIYTLLPLLPIIILIFIYIININLPKENKIVMSVEIVTLVSFLITIVCELIRKKNPRSVLKDTENFFKGIGGAMDIVALLVSAGVFVKGLQSIGIISHLQVVMQSTSSAGFILPLILVLMTALIVILSGSGVALFYSMVPLMAPLAFAANIEPFAISIPMGLAGNLLRAVSPVSAVIIIIAGTTKLDPFDIVKRTSVPMIVGLCFMFILSMILFL